MLHSLALSLCNFGTHEGQEEEKKRLHQVCNPDPGSWSSEGSGVEGETEPTTWCPGRRMMFTRICTIPVGRDGHGPQ